MPVALLLLAFLVVPLVEIYVIIQVGQAIGSWPTVALLLAEGVLGSWLVRREGRRAWDALRREAGSGHLPSRQLADGALILIGGTLLLAPGFVTDVVGFFLVLPPTRPLARRLLVAALARRALRGTARMARVRSASRPRDDGRPEPQVVRGEVVDDGQHPPSMS